MTCRWASFFGLSSSWFSRFSKRITWLMLKNVGLLQFKYCNFNWNSNLHIFNCPITFKNKLLFFKQKVVFSILKQPKKEFVNVYKIKTQQFFNKRHGMREVNFKIFFKRKNLTMYETWLSNKISKMFFLPFYELEKIETNFKFQKNS